MMHFCTRTLSVNLKKGIVYKSELLKNGDLTLLDDFNIKIDTVYAPYINDYFTRVSYIFPKVWFKLQKIIK